jgi:hypothetical protein
MTNAKRTPRRSGNADSRERQIEKQEDRLAQHNNVGNPALPGEPAPRRGNPLHGDLDDRSAEHREHAQDERVDEQR